MSTYFELSSVTERAERDVRATTVSASSFSWRFASRIEYWTWFWLRFSDGQYLLWIDKTLSKDRTALSLGRFRRYSSAKGGNCCTKNAKELKTFYNITPLLIGCCAWSLLDGARDFQATNGTFGCRKEEVIFNQQTKTCFLLFCVLLYVIKEMVHGLVYGLRL